MSCGIVYHRTEDYVTKLWATSTSAECLPETNGLPGTAYKRENPSDALEHFGDTYYTAAYLGNFTLSTKQRGVKLGVLG